MQSPGFAIIRGTSSENSTFCLKRDLSALCELCGGSPFLLRGAFLHLMHRWEASPFGRS